MSATFRPSTVMSAEPSDVAVIVPEKSSSTKTLREWMLTAMSSESRLTS